MDELEKYIIIQFLKREIHKLMCFFHFFKLIIISYIFL